MKKLGMGLIGPGFVAAHHLDAVGRLGDVDIVAIAGSSQSAEKEAQAYKVTFNYRDNPPRTANSAYVRL
jgi:predicted dehydrogenase